MSFLLGHGKKSKPEFTGLSIQTSNSAIPISIGFGLCRTAPNIVWQGDFQSHAKKAGGKGGGGKGSKTYTYTASFALSLGWGPSTALINVWKDQSKTAGYAPFTFIAGNIPQSPWGFLTSNHAAQALGYPGLILVCASNLDLGNANTLSQYSFEVQWPLYNTAPGGKGDADVALCIDKLLNGTIYGALIGAPMQLDYLMSTGAATTTGDNAFQTYCKAMGFGMSPVLDSQESCLNILNRWTNLFNADLTWTGYSMGFITRSSDPLVGNGVTYLPDNTLEFQLNDANGDFIFASGQEPVRLRRARRSGLPSYGYLEIKNRSNSYNTEPVPWDDQGLIDQFGPIPNSNVAAHDICEPSIGAICAQLYGQRVAYAPNHFEFDIGPGYLYLVAGSQGTITDPMFGTQTVRIIDIAEQGDGSFAVLAEEWTVTIGRSSNATQEPASNTPINTEVPTTSVNAPLIFEPPSTLAGSVAQVWIAVSAGPAGAFDPNWGGCFVWLSTDNATFANVGEIDTPARMGVLTTGLAAYASANPDTVDSFGVNLTESNGTLTGVTATDASNFISGCVIQDAGGNLEFLSYRDATLTAANKYTLGGQLYRAQYGTTGGSHLSGALFAKLDAEIFKYNLPPQFIGKTLYVKFQSFNIFGGGVQDITTCTSYTLVPAGAGYGGGAGGTPTTTPAPTLTPSAGYNTITWTANPPSDNITRYDIYRAPGLGAAFGTAVLIGSAGGAATTYTDSTASPGVAYTYFVRPVNAIGAGTASPGTGVTSSTSSGGELRFYGSIPDMPGASEELFDIEMVGGEAFDAAFPNNIGGCLTAPTGSVTFIVKKNTTAVGLMSIAAGATVATWTLGSSLSFANGDRLKFYGPSAQDPTLSGVSYTFRGRK